MNRALISNEDELRRNKKYIQELENSLKNEKEAKEGRDKEVEELIEKINQKEYIVQIVNKENSKINDELNKKA